MENGTREKVKIVFLDLNGLTNSTTNSIPLMNEWIRSFIQSDYKEVKFLKITGYTLCRNIHYIDRFHDYSSSDLRKRIYKAEKDKEDLENFKQNEGSYYE